MATKLSIYNRALQKIGQASLASLDANNKSIRELETAYNPTLKKILRRYPWNFAIRRVSLSASGDTPVYGFEHEYLLPIDCLRILEVDHKGYLWKVEQAVSGGNLKAVVTDLSSPIKVRYIKFEENTALYDPLFAELLAHMIAIEICEPITQSNTKKDILLAELKTVRADALAADGQEDTPDEVDDGSWWESRV